MMAYIGAALQHSGMLTLQQFSYTVAAGFCGMFVGTVFFGLGSDYFGRRTAFILMLLIYFNSLVLLIGFELNVSIASLKKIADERKNNLADGMEKPT